MKAEKWISCLVGVVLAFLLSFGSVGCLASAFSMDVGMPALALCCGLAAVMGGLCYLLKRGDAIVACVFALILGYLWRRGTLVSSFETLLYVISCRYDGGYGWGVFGRVSGTVLAALSLTGAMIALAAVRTVCRRDISFPAMTLALIPLLLCVVVTDTVPGGGCLFVLLLGMILMLLTGSLRRSDPSQANTLTAMALIPVVLALGLLFLAVPADTYVNRTEELQDTLIRWGSAVPQLWEGLTVSEDAIAANDDRIPNVNLEHLGPRKLYTYAVMDVVAETGGILYLREQDYNTYSRSGWAYTVNREESFGLGGTLGESAGTVTVTTRRARDVIYYPYYPAEAVQMVGGCVINDQGNTDYTLERYVLPKDWKQNLPAPQNTPALQLPIGDAFTQAGYQRLPAETREWAEPMVAGILGDARTATEIADAVAAYVLRSARYDLNTPQMDDDAEEFARWFLEESETGYCVHFATAAAVLLRAAGVDARYVTGYMIPVQAGEQVTVTAENAHAWVEYYEPLLNTWIVLEVTPGDGVGALEDPTQEETAASTEESETVNQTDPTETEAGSAVEDTQTNPGSSEIGRFIGMRILRKLLPPILLAAGIWLQREIRMAIRRRRMHRGGATRRCLALWREVVLYSFVLKRRPPNELEALAQKAKFSQHTLTQQELMQFDTWLREQRRQFRGKPWYLRLVYGCIYAI